MFSYTSFFRFVARLVPTVAAGVLLLLGTGNAMAHGDYSPVSMRETMDNLILPGVEFRQTSLTTALEFLRQEAARISPQPDPTRRQINLILNAPEVAMANPKITLSLRQIPLMEALKYVASQAGLKVKAEFYAVSLVPLTENTEPLVTAEFRVPPGFFGNRPARAGGVNPLDQRATSAQ